MKWPLKRCRQGLAPRPADEINEDLLDRAYVEDRLRTVELRFEPARRAILTRHGRNHWTESFEEILRDGSPT